MFLCVSVIIAIIVALIRGGKWSNFKKFKFEMQWLVFIAIMLQVIIFNSIWEKYQGLKIYTNEIFIISMVILLIFFLANIKIRGIIAILSGTFSNTVAILANGGYMPADPALLKNILSNEEIVQMEAGFSNYHSILISEQTKLKYLCDIIYVPNINVYSIGDLLIVVGAFIIVQYIMLNRGEVNKN